MSTPQAEKLLHPMPGSKITSEDFRQIIGWLVYVISWNRCHVHLDGKEAEIWKMLETEYQPIVDDWKKEKLIRLTARGNQ